MMSKLIKLFYNSDDNWKKASKKVNRLGLGQVIFWIASSTSLGGKYIASSQASDAGFISMATVFSVLFVFFIVANILIIFNFFKCVKNPKSSSVVHLLQGQKSLLCIDLVCCFTPIVILTKFFFWRGYRKMPRK